MKHQSEKRWDQKSVTALCFLKLQCTLLYVKILMNFKTDLSQAPCVDDHKERKFSTHHFYTSYVPLLFFKFQVTDGLQCANLLIHYKTDFFLTSTALRLSFMWSWQSAIFYQLVVHELLPFNTCYYLNFWKQELGHY